MDQDPLSGLTHQPAGQKKQHRHPGSLNGDQAQCVNPFDAADVLWAVQTRCTPESGIYLIPNLPSYTREDVRDVHRGKVGIDATAPLGRGDLFTRRRFPGEETIALEDYLD